MSNAERWNALKELKDHLKENANKNDISEEEGAHLLNELSSLRNKLKNLGIGESDIDSFIHFGKEIILSDENGEIEYQIKRSET